MSLRYVSTVRYRNYTIMLVLGFSRKSNISQLPHFQGEKPTNLVHCGCGCIQPTATSTFKL